VAQSAGDRPDGLGARMTNRAPSTCTAAMALAAPLCHSALRRVPRRPADQRPHPDRGIRCDDEIRLQLANAVPIFGRPSLQAELAAGLSDMAI
jgi:hypothetical protein